MNDNPFVYESALERLVRSRIIKTEESVSGGDALIQLAGRLDRSPKSNWV